ncbi:MAG: hypothetical protein Q7R43_04680, partial [Candidatus Daviesbacteria bacterium]|nr:hypothetical protein [Candidatus Daviesbacteria bacterium]
MKKKVAFIFFFVILAGLFLSSGFITKSSSFRNFLAHNFNNNIKGVSSENLKLQEIIINGRKKIKYPQDLTIVMIGDSMTERLGNSDEIRADLKKYNPNKSVEILNYGFGSTNILSVPERLEKDTFFQRTFRPILDIDFDLVLIESFGFNPLSQFSLEEGLKKQTDTLDQIISKIKAENPRAKIIFVATIAPSRYHYGENTVDLTPEKRMAWADERIAYIKNHIDFAKSH